MCNLATFLLFNCISNFNCYFVHVYIVTVFFTLICGNCSSAICLCNCAISSVLLYCCIVTLCMVRLSLVTIKGYLLACLRERHDLYWDEGSTGTFDEAGPQAIFFSAPRARSRPRPCLRSSVNPILNAITSTII